MRSRSPSAAAIVNRARPREPAAAGRSRHRTGAVRPLLWRRASRARSQRAAARARVERFPVRSTARGRSPAGLRERSRSRPQAGAMDGMHVRAPVEQEGDSGARSSDHGAVQRRAPGPVAVVHERRIGIEQRADAADVAGSAQGGSEIGARHGRLDTAAARARLLEEPGDFVVAAIPRHVGERRRGTSSRPVARRRRAGPAPLRRGLRVRQIDQRPVESVPAAERRPAFEQTAQGRRVAGRGRRDCVTDVALGAGVGFVRRGHNRADYIDRENRTMRRPVPNCSRGFRLQAEGCRRRTDFHLKVEATRRPD